MGRMLPHAMALRGAVSVSLAFFGVRRASEIAALPIAASVPTGASHRLT